MDSGTFNSIGATDTRGAAAARLGVLLLTSAEAMFFAALAGAALVLKSAQPATFAAAAMQLNRPLAAVGALGLLVGSALVTASVASARLRAGLVLTLMACLSGAISIAAIITQLLHNGPRLGGNNALAAYFLVAGSLAAHETAAVLIALVILARRPRTTAVRSAALRPWRIYWHLGIAAAVLVYLLFYLQR